jgi:hypothetical protein
MFLGIEHIELHIGVSRRQLHRAGIAAGVHENHWHALFGDSLERTRIVRQGRNVVDDIRTGRDGAAHHFGIAGIDRDARIDAPGQSLDHRQHAPQFLVDRHWLRTRAGGFTADVQDLRPFFRKAPCVSDRCRRIAEAATVGKTVRSDVHDPHDARPIERKAGETRPLLPQGLEICRGSERRESPVALRETGNARYPPASAASCSPLDRFDRREIEPAPGKPQALRGRRGHLFGGNQPDRAYVNVTHARPPQVRSISMCPFAGRVATERLPQRPAGAKRAFATRQGPPRPNGNGPSGYPFH